jgi:DNA-binding PadR family transcriptional regulator
MSVPVQLFVLGVLAQKERHGYEINALVKARGLGGWSGFGLGSLYHALAALEKAGDIKARRIERRGRYPSRSVYAITRKGRDTVGRLLVEASQAARFEDPIDLVLGFIPLVPAADRRELLALRLGELEEATRAASEKAREFRSRGAEPWTLATLDRAARQGQAQLEWLKRVMDEVDGW